MSDLGPRSKQIRRDIVALSKANGGYHYGGSFSCVEILLALYDRVLKLEDKFILSKGHSCWGLYVLLRERGLSPKIEGHPSLDEQNGIHFTTGSEGHGFPAGVGMAFSRKLQKKPGRVYVLMGDGECQEGTTWESLLLAGFHKLSNLTVIVDHNTIQGSGFVANILPVVDVVYDAAMSCGWGVNPVDGHNVDQLERAFKFNSPPDMPHLVIAKTVKGKGVSFMEGQSQWHSRWPSPTEEAQMLAELA